MTADPDWDYALCAPGGKLDAELRLLVAGASAAEVCEHPYLSFLKPGEVVLMRKPPEFDIPFPLTFEGDAP